MKTLTVITFAVAVVLTASCGGTSAPNGNSETAPPLNCESIAEEALETGRSEHPLRENADFGIKTTLAWQDENLRPEVKACIFIVTVKVEELSLAQEFQVFACYTDTDYLSIDITDSSEMPTEFCQRQLLPISNLCKPWEIFDPTLEAAGRGGGNGGIQSSAVGCVRVCYIEAGGISETTLSPAEMKLVPHGQANTPSEWQLLYSRTDITKNAHGKHPTLAVTGTGLATVMLGAERMIEVTPNQRACRVIFVTGQEITELRSP